PNPKDPNKTETAGNVRIMALGIVHAANMGATIINISAFACIPVSRPIDQATLGGALRYATLEKRALVVGAAGNLMQDCASQNPLYSPSRPGDPRNWEGVTTISSPCWCW
ncbi:type VII secretion-associated serine protease, partial [Pseudomonas guariconensis]